MTIAKWMYRAWNADVELQELEQEQRREYDRATSITAQMSGSVTSGAKDPHKLDSYVAFSAVVEEQRKKLQITKAEVAEAIFTLEDERCRRILFLRFVRCMPWKEIYTEMHYSETQSKRIYKKAMKDIAPAVAERMKL